MLGHFGDGALLVGPARWFRTLLVDPARLRALSSNQPRPPTGQRLDTWGAPGDGALFAIPDSVHAIEFGCKNSVVLPHLDMHGGVQT